MIDSATVRKDVLHFLEAFSGKPNADIKDADRLSIELHLDHPAFIFLAMSLRGYIQHLAPGATLKTSEIETDSFTVLKLIELVSQRVGL